MSSISPAFTIKPSEVKVRTIRAQGPGGQHVNKVSTAVQLYFDIPASSLPEAVKQRLLAVRDHRLTRSGVLILKSQNHRSRMRNIQTAQERLQEWVNTHAVAKKTRRATRMPKSIKEKRLQQKKNRSLQKSLRRKVEW